MDAVFRSTSEPAKPQEASKSSEAAMTNTSKVEVPYTSYAQEHSKPFIVDHFQLGDTWSDPVGGFPNEIATIESYLESQITSGELSNSVEAIKEKIKAIEKMNNIPKEARTVVKIGTLAAYVKFLMKTQDIKDNIRRYANS